MTDVDEPLGEPVHNRRRVPPEQRLYQAKILQHVQDLHGPLRPEAEHFLRADNPDFCQFCLGAGWEPEWIVARLGRVVAGRKLRIHRGKHEGDE